MNFQNKTRHMVDILFVLALFAVFALSALLLVMFDSKIYQNTVTGMNENYTLRNSYSYITEKIRQSDTENSVQTGLIQDASAIVITTETNQTLYETYLYYYDGYIKELFIKKGDPADPTAGQNILKVNSFAIEQINSSLYSFKITDEQSQTIEFLVDHKSH